MARGEIGMRKFQGEKLVALLALSHFVDARLPRVDGILRGVERPVAFVVLALAEPHHGEYA